MEEWIRVKDKTPNVGDMVLSYSGTGIDLAIFPELLDIPNPDVSFYTHWDHIDNPGYLKTFYNTVTHWMLLPEPPNINSEWINIKDRLPDDNLRKITYSSSSNIDIVSWWGGRWIAFYGSGTTHIFQPGEITHWMLLPEKPTNLKEMLI